MDSWLEEAGHPTPDDNMRLPQWLGYVAVKPPWWLVSRSQASQSHQRPSDSSSLRNPGSVLPAVAVRTSAASMS
jgi:hypothetical protein